MPPCRGTEFTRGFFRMAVNRKLEFSMPLDTIMLCPRCPCAPETSLQTATEVSLRPEIFEAKTRFSARSVVLDSQASRSDAEYVDDAVEFTLDEAVAPTCETDSADRNGLLAAGLVLAGAVGGLVVMDRKRDNEIGLLDDVFSDDMLILDK